MAQKVAGGPDINREATADAAVGVFTNRNMGNEIFIFKQILRNCLNLVLQILYRPKDATCTIDKVIATTAYRTGRQQ